MKTLGWILLGLAILGLVMDYLPDEEEVYTEPEPRRRIIIIEEA